MTAKELDDWEAEGNLSLTYPGMMPDVALQEIEFNGSVLRLKQSVG